MIERLFEERIRALHPANAIEQENAIQEVVQTHLLASLARAGLFSRAAFQGGTCLRLLYDLNRFSEDLDFLLLEPDPAFRWQPYLDAVRDDCAELGIQFEVQDRSRADAAVKSAFLKTDSIGKVLLVDLPYSRDSSRKVRVKLEIDSNPPAGSRCETRYLTFPVPTAITAQTPDCGFATKSHALLCRSYDKGRDWYDFIWYVGRRTCVDYRLLANALRQLGPWQGQSIEVTREWYVEALGTRISHVDWREVRADVSRFLPARDQEGLRRWNRDFFLQLTEQLAAYLPQD